MKEQMMVLITGATGNIGKKLRSHLSGRYTLRLLDIDGDDDPAVTAVDLSQWDERIIEFFGGVDCVVHLAADADETKSWEELTAPNLDALNNVFVAAIKARVPRVVFASSNHVMGGYKDETRTGKWLTTKLDPRPGTQEADIWFKRMWLSTRDMCQLMEQAITVQMPAKSFVVLNGMSDNEDMVWDIDATKKVLGYEPKDSLK